ncbi:Tar ligand binding domain-containing protein [Escherichia coli]
MLKRIKIVTSLLLVLAVFGLLQLTSGGLFFNALKKVFPFQAENLASVHRKEKPC